MLTREESRGGTRADIVVRFGVTTLIIENKVYSPESDRQCEGLYGTWQDAGPDVRYLLLSLNGQPPRTTHSQAAADAWRSISYAALGQRLEELMVDALRRREATDKTEK
jgi:hypothetical protein